MDQRNKYLKLTEEQKGELYHGWVKKHGFTRFTEWEEQVLDRHLLIDFGELESTRNL